MTQALSDAALDQILRTARTFNKFQDKPVSDETLKSLYELAKWGPTSMNCQAMRVVFVRSPEAKAKLKQALMPGNVDKTMAAPVTGIVCWDLDFTDHLPTVWPKADVRGFYPDEEARRASARTNALIQAGALIVAARALGLGVGPMGGFDRAKVQAEFLAGSGWEVAFLMNLGWPAANPEDPRAPRLGFETVARVV